MSTLPKENNNNHGILGTIGKIASYARDNIPQLRGVSMLGNRLRDLDRMPYGYGALRRDAAAPASASSRFGKFTNPNSGNIASSGNITANTGRMTSPSEKDSDTPKKWGRFNKWQQ